MNEHDNKIPLILRSVLNVDARVIWKKTGTPVAEGLCTSPGTGDGMPKLPVELWVVLV